MNPHDFYRTVREMRDAQKKYFSTRDEKVLSESKRLEKKVDEMVAEYFSKQTKLFQ